MEEKITIELIESKEFTSENGGYCRKEVDRFLDQICDEMAAMQDEMDALKQQLKVSEARTRMTPAVQPVPQAAAVPDSEFREILEMAQRVKSETIANAERKAEEILTQAREKAQTVLGDLDTQKATLQGEVEAIKASAVDFRAKLAELMKAHQDVLDRTKGLF